MIVTCEYTRISLGVPYFDQVQRHCAHRNHKLKSNVYLVNFSLIYLLMAECYNSIPPTIKSKTYPRHLGGFMGIFNPQIISRTQPLVIVSDLAKFKPLPLSDIKMVGVTGLAPAASWLQIRPSPNWQYTPIKMVRKTGFAPVPHNPELCDYIIIYFLIKLLSVFDERIFRSLVLTLVTDDHSLQFL